MQCRFKCYVLYREIKDKHVLSAMSISSIKDGNAARSIQLLLLHVSDQGPPSLLLVTAYNPHPIPTGAWPSFIPTADASAKKSSVGRGWQRNMNCKAFRTTATRQPTPQTPSCWPARPGWASLPGEHRAPKVMLGWGARWEGIRKPCKLQTWLGATEIRLTVVLLDNSPF